MKQPRTRVAHTIADMTLKSGLTKKLSNGIAAYLLNEGRVKELDSLLRDIQADWADVGHIEVITRSAHRLEASVKADIKSRTRKLYPKAKQIVLSEIIDESVIGGVSLSFPHQQLDLSVEAKLNKFKQLTAAGKD
jgi:F0F1-type ATP synthase delta subunit